jgi:hypothetical protein
LVGSPNVNWNLLNAFHQGSHPAPVNSMANPNFSRILNAAAGREIQLAAKVNF